METLESRIAHLTLWDPNASGPEAPAATLHEPPELLHFGDPLDGCANDFGVCRHAQELLGPAQSTLVHEEGFALQCFASHDGLQAWHPDRHTFYFGSAYCQCVGFDTPSG